MGGVHFLGFEGAVGGAVMEAVGGEFLAGGVVENVEALEGDQQGFGDFEEDVFDFRIGQGGGLPCWGRKADRKSGLTRMRYKVT